MIYMLFLIRFFYYKWLAFVESHSLIRFAILHPSQPNIACLFFIQIYHECIWFFSLYQFTILSMLCHIKLPCGDSFLLSLLLSCISFLFSPLLLKLFNSLKIFGQTLDCQEDGIYRRITLAFRYASSSFRYSRPEINGL